MPHTHSLAIRGRIEGVQGGKELAFGTSPRRGYNHQTIDAGLCLRAIIHNDTLARYPAKIRINECHERPLNWSGTWQWDTRNDDFGASLPQWLPIVAGLPSLRRLSGEALIGHCSMRSKPYSGTELTYINLTRSDIDVKIFKYLLSRTKALQTFLYS